MVEKVGGDGVVRCLLGACDPVLKVGATDEDHLLVDLERGDESLQHDLANELHWESRHQSRTCDGEER